MRKSVADAAAQETPRGTDKSKARWNMVGDCFGNRGSVRVSAQIVEALALSSELEVGESERSATSSIVHERVYVYKSRTDKAGDDTVVGP